MADTNKNAHQELTLESLAQMVQDQGKLIASLQLENATLKGIASDSNKVTKKLSIPTETVTVDGKEYKWNVAHFKLPGAEVNYYTAEEAATDEEVIKQILSIKGQGILTEIV